MHSEGVRGSIRRVAEGGSVMKTFLAVLVSMALISWPIEVLPCACCAYSGQWSVSPGVVFTENSQWFLDALGTVHLAGTLASAEHG